MISNDYPLLIDPATLLTQIQDPNLCLFDCRFSLAEPELGLRAYREGHLPGAHHADLEEHLSSPVGAATGRHPLPDPRQLADWLGRRGVGPKSRLILYDDAGGAFAGRLWWLLRWLGHRQVALLDGGFQAWVAAGGEVTEEIPRPLAREAFGYPSEADWISTDRLEAALAAERVLVLDARAPERYRGEVEPIDPVAGHIPGSINLPMTGNLDAEGRFLPLERLRERFLTALGETPAGQVVHLCGSGVTACHNLLAMELAGLTGSRLYVGSWSEWIRSPARAVARGDEPRVAGTGAPAVDLSPE